MNSEPPTRSVHPASATARRSRPAAALAVPALGFGGAALGNLYHALSDQSAAQAIEQALALGVRYFDTAPFYGYGLSERRLGAALGGPTPDGVIISTKVGRRIVPAEDGAAPGDGFEVRGQRARFDYSREGVLRSLESSLERLRRTRVDILLLHDVGRETHGAQHERMLRQALDEALPAMAHLKATGVCRAIGIGVNEAAVCLEILPRFPLDYLLLAGRYTLLEQNLGATGPGGGVLEEALRRGVGVLIGGPYNSGLLAAANAPGQTYNYRPVDALTRQRAERVYGICAEEGVDVGAAALQFPLAHPAVVSVIAGIRSAQEAASTVQRMRTPLPASLWERLRRAGVLAAGVPTP